VLEESTRLRARLDAMALELARREGDAQATAWKVAELERRLAEATSGAAAPSSSVTSSSPSSPSSSPTRSQELTAALDQIDALRSALTQEHEQRMRAEGALKRSTGAGPESAEPTV
jgi:hypothetical protein